MRAALIGLGMVSKAHLAALRDAEGVTLGGVFGRSSEKVQEFVRNAQKNFESPIEEFDTIETLAHAQNIDFVILTTPPDARLDIIQTLTAHGKPILMEKPLERNLTNALRVVEMCETAPIPSAVVFQNRTRSAVQKLRKELLAGELGDITSADIQVPWWRDQSYYDVPGRGTYARDGGGVLINQAIHTLDLALWLLGPWKSVQAQLHLTTEHQMEAEDWAGAVFETLGGVVGTLMATTAAYPGSAESITLRGTKATALLQNGEVTCTFRNGTTKRFGQSARSGAGADPMAFSHVWHQRIIEDFCAAIKTGTPPLATPRSALAAHAAIDAMERSHAKGQREEVYQT